jgi:diguanylate cyclase (GGDEF)-like protein
LNQSVANLLIPSRWTIWTIPRRILAPVLIVETTGVLVFGLAAVSAGIGNRESWLIAVGISTAGVVHGEIAMRIERTRRRISRSIHVDLTSVWTFAAVMLLPPILAVAICVVMQVHLWRRAWSPRVPLYRLVFTITAAGLACVASAAALRYAAGVPADGFGVGAPGGVTGSNGVLAVAVAIMVYTTVNTALIAGAVIVSSAKPDLAAAVGDVDENLLEIATLSFGALLAAAAAISWWLSALAVLPLFVLHRATLTRQLQTAADVDGKTGLLNAAAWHNQAERELDRARRRGTASSVLVIDLDDFKIVNDTHGHLAGDLLLTAVAEAITAEVRGDDLVGRFGGDEFVVLLNGRGADTETVAERIRRRVASVVVELPTGDGPVSVSGVGASVGAAEFPADATDLGGLMHAADAALYVQKRALRGRREVADVVELLKRAGVDTGLHVADLGLGEPGPATT